MKIVMLPNTHIFACRLLVWISISLRLYLYFTKNQFIFTISCGDRRVCVSSKVGVLVPFTNLISSTPSYIVQSSIVYQYTKFWIVIL